MLISDVLIENKTQVSHLFTKNRIRFQGFGLFTTAWFQEPDSKFGGPSQYNDIVLPV